MTLLTDPPRRIRSIGVETQLPTLPGYDTAINAIAVHGDRLFATHCHGRPLNGNDSPAVGTLRVLDRVTLAEVAPAITVGWIPAHVVVNPTSRHIHVFNYGAASKDVSVIGLDSLALEATIPIGGGFGRMAVDTAANVLYVLNTVSGEVIAFDGDEHHELRRHRVGPGVNDLTIDEAGRWLYVSRYTNTPFVDRVEVVDLAPPGPTGPRFSPPIVFPARSRPRRVVYDDSTDRLYVWLEGVGATPTTPEIPPGIEEIDRAVTPNARRFVRLPGLAAFELDDFRGLVHALSTIELDSFATDTHVALTPQVLGNAQSPRVTSLAVDRETSAVAVGDIAGRIRLVHPDLTFGDAPQAPPGAAVTITSHDDRLDVFVVGNDDRLRTAHWSPETDWDFDTGWTEVPDALPIGTPTAAISRFAQEWELFTVRNGDLSARRGRAGQVLTEWEALGAGFPARAHVAAVSRFGGERTVFAVADDGQVHLYGGAGATEHVVLGGGPALTPGTPVVATSRKSDHWDLFVLADDGQVWTNWWSADDGFGGWGTIGGTFAPATPISAISRGRTDIELFAVRNDGQIVMQYWHSEDGWSGWFPVAGDNNDAPTTAIISVVGRPDDQRDLFVVRADRQIWTHRGGAWRPIGGRATQTGAPVAAASRGHWVHLCWAAEGGAVETAWFHPLQANGGWSLDNGVRMTVPTETRLFKVPVETNAHLGGQVVTRVWRDGTVRVEGHMHGSGWDPYRFSVYSAVHAESGIGLMNHHRGRVDGTGSEPFPWDPKPDRDDDWIDVGVNPVVLGGFDDFATTGGTAASADFKNIGLGGGISGFVDGVLDGFLQPYVLSPIRKFNKIATFIGHEANEYVGFIPTFQSPLLLGNAISWIPGADFLVPIARWNADPFVNHRIIEGDELDWAERVFGFSLPPAERIVLTDAVGIKDAFEPGDGRCFVCPTGDDGIILINLGKAYENPTTFTNDSYEEPGELFIHELTHVWHVTHTSMSRLKWTWGAIGDSDYSVPAPGTPWSDVKFEGKATAVSTWYARHHATGLDSGAAHADPLFPYIHKVRTRQTDD